MSWLPYLYNALIAAAVGAGTNQVAVVAILRVILPRKKGELARRIRDIVATELLSPEKMRDKMDEPRVGVLLRENIDRTLAEFLERDLPSPDVLFGAELDAAIARLRAGLLREYEARVGDPALAREAIRPFLAERWQTLKPRTPKEISARAGEFAADAGSWVADLRQSEALRHSVSQALDRWLAEWARTSGGQLPPGLARATEELAASQAPLVADSLAGAVRTPAVNNAIAAAAMDAVARQFKGQGILGNIKGAVAGMLRIEDDVRGVVRRLPDALRDSLNRPESLARFAEMLRSAVRAGMERDFAVQFRDDDRRQRWVESALEHLWTGEVFSTLGRRASEILSRSFDHTLADSLARAGLEESEDAILDGLAERCRRMLASGATRSLLTDEFDDAVAAWRGRPLGRLERYVGEGARRRLAAAAAEEARLALRERVLEFATEAGVWDVVTESVEGYDDRALSDLVMRLARTELRWVTVLGGAIGFVAGIIQTVLQRGWQ